MRLPLDHNFPEPILDQMAPWMGDLQLVPLRRIDERLEGVGHDPIRATGALLLDLQPAVDAMRSGRTGVFWLRPRAPQPQDPWELFERAAGNHGRDAEALYDDVKVSDAELDALLL